MLTHHMNDLEQLLGSGVAALMDMYITVYTLEICQKDDWSSIIHVVGSNYGMSWLCKEKDMNGVFPAFKKPQGRRRQK
ncbi:hypothetical protein PS15p_212032 [Mucor circinelloides]